MRYRTVGGQIFEELVIGGGRLFFILPLDIRHMFCYNGSAIKIGGNE